MTKGITAKEPDPEIIYADIFHLPHHVSDHHPAMSLYDRAAQFAPFAALSGYDDMIEEEARLADNKIELGEDETEALERKLGLISSAISGGEKPTLTITYFIPDPLKAGGRYETKKLKIRRLDTVARVLILEEKTGRAGSYATIPLTNLLDISGDLVDP